MKRALPIVLTILIALLAARGSMAQTRPITDEDLQDTSDVDDSAPAPRVARISFIDGDVSFLRAGVTDWAPAVRNLPLLAGDQLYTPQGARAEIQLSSGTFVRLLDNSTLSFSELSDSSTQLEVIEGSALIRFAGPANRSGRFELDTPAAAVVLTSSGTYKVTVIGRDESEIAVHEGVAEVSTDDGSIRVRSGYRLSVNSASSSHIQLVADNFGDWWNDWDYATGLARQTSPEYVRSYESNYQTFYGADDLTSYGSWVDNSDYGYCWVPRVSSGWAPYRYGQWLWVPSTGWTWLADEPWGWAPYHYGRWSLVPGLGWAWVPGFRRPGLQYAYWDYRWRPALVTFFNYPSGRGNYVGWYPLAPGQRWHRPDWHRNDERSRLHYPGDRGNWQRPGDEHRWIDPRRPPAGVTSVPVEAFQRPTKSAGLVGNLNGGFVQGTNGSARPGLPDIKPLPIATRPAGDAARHRVFTPPQDVESRPVVVRNQPSNTNNESNVRRERRLISPRPIQIGSDDGSGSSHPRKNENGPVIVPIPDTRSSEERHKDKDRNRVNLPSANGGDNTGKAGNGQNQSDDESRRKAEREERRRLRDQQNGSLNTGGNGSGGNGSNGKAPSGSGGSGSNGKAPGGSGGSGSGGANNNQSGGDSRGRSFDYERRNREKDDRPNQIVHQPESNHVRSGSGGNSDNGGSKNNTNNTHQENKQQQQQQREERKNDAGPKKH